MIRYQEVGRQPFVEKPQSGFRRMRFSDLMSQIFQKSDGAAGDQKIVVDKEYLRPG
jgi:hypothetical protein